MPSNAQPQPGSNRRFLWLAVFIVLLFGGYSAGWFYLAGRLEAQAQAAFASLSRDGTVAECANAQARGFPFRLGIFCNSVAFEDAAQGISLSAGSFRSAGQIYDPQHLVAELDGPARIDLPQTGPLALQWENLRASIRLATPLPERLSLESRNVTVATSTGQALAAAETFESHMRPNGGDLDLAARFGGLTLDPAMLAGNSLPPLAGEADLKVDNGVSLVGRHVTSLRGQSGTIRNMALSTGETTAIIVSGPFAIDQDGLVDAQIKLTVRDPQGLAAALSTALPQLRQEIEQVSAGLSLLGDAPTVPVKISKGRASMGFIKLGNIPPLD
jgi:hypothetical protein